MTGIWRKFDRLAIGVCTRRQLFIGQTSFLHNNNADKLGKVLGKLMGGKRKKYYKDDAVERSRPDSLDFLKPKNAKVLRRITVLNSVIMESICDVMSTGELSPELMSLGLEITHVKVNSDFTTVNVYWTSSISENTSRLEQVLPSYAGKLRNIMCSLRVLGNVPYVVFVKDRHLKNLIDVQEALERADFGPDFVPSHKSPLPRSITTIKQSIPDIPGLQLVNVDNNSRPITEPLSLEPLIANSTNSSPEMRMDVFNLDHRMIIEHIVRNMKSAKATHRTSESGIPTRLVSDDVVQCEDSSEVESPKSRSPIDDEEERKLVKRVNAANTYPKMPDSDIELRRLLRRGTRDRSEIKRRQQAMVSTDDYNDIDDVDESAPVNDEMDFYDEEFHTDHDYNDKLNDK